MRTLTLLCAAAALSAPTAARACDPVAAEGLPAVVAFPAYTPEGVRVGTVEAPVSAPYPLEISRFTGQPRTVVYDGPGSASGAVDPGLTLVPLPRSPRFHTRAVFPRGY